MYGIIQPKPGEYFIHEGIFQVTGTLLSQNFELREASYLLITSHL